MTEQRTEKGCGLDEVCQSSRAHLPQFSKRPNTPGRFARSNRGLEIAFLCAPRLYCALTLRRYIGEHERKREREKEEERVEGRSKWDKGARSLKLERPVYCTIRDAGEKDCNGFS